MNSSGDVIFPFTKIPLSPKKAYLTFLLLSLFSYGITVFNGYNIDDYLVVENHEQVQRGFAALPEIFTTYYGNTIPTGGGVPFEYRPMVKATYAIEYGLFGTNPGISHLINVLLYCLCCCVWFSALLKLFGPGKSLLVFIALLIFLIHPIHTEVVCSLKNRDVILSTLFGGLTFGFGIRYYDEKNAKYLLFALIAFFLSLISKLANLPIIILLPLAILMFRNLDWKNALKLFASLGILAIAYSIFISIFFPEVERFGQQYIENPLSYEESIWVRLATSFYALGYYAKLSLLPYPLIFFYGYRQVPIVNWTSFIAIASLVFHGLIFGLAVKKFKTNNLLSFGIFFYLISIFMFSNILVPATGTIAERFMFLPSIGFSILVSVAVIWILKNIGKYKNLAILVFAVIIMGPSVIWNNVRSTQWKSKISLTSHDAGVATNSVITQMLAGSILHQIADTTSNPLERKNLFRQSAQYFENAFELWEPFEPNFILIALIKIHKLEEPKAAIGYFEKKLLENPHGWYFEIALGMCYEKMNNQIEAVIHFSKAEQMMPGIETHPKEYIYRFYGDPIRYSF